MTDDQFSATAAAMAREAGALLMQYFRRRVEVEYKGEADVVTVADRAAEELLMARLRARWPEHQIMAEEGSSHKSASEYRWYVDPLDGTTNFAHGFPVFCVSLGLEHHGELIAGVLLVREAGGTVTNFSGGAFDISSREVLASNGHIHQQMIETLAEVFAGKTQPLPEVRSTER